MGQTLGSIQMKQVHSSTISNQLYAHKVWNSLRGHQLYPINNMHTKYGIPYSTPRRIPCATGLHLILGK